MTGIKEFSKRNYQKLDQILLQYKLRVLAYLNYRNTFI